MELGEKLRLARLEKGISQRQLCGDTITRNMLSRIEHGAARPSMDTLRYLAGQLGLPVSYFLEEDTLSSPNQQALTQARESFRRGDWPSLKAALGAYQAPDPVFQPEWELLQYESLLHQAEEALSAGQLIFARELLDIAENLETGLYIGSAHRTRRLLLLSRAGADPVKLAQALPDLDGVLLLKLRAQPAKRQLALLAGIENRDLPQYSLLLGKAHFALKDYAAAVPPLQQAEASFPREVRPLLETCFRELGDFRQAYEYACKQR